MQAPEMSVEKKSPSPIQRYAWLLVVAGAAACAFWEYVDINWLAHSPIGFRYVWHVAGTTVPMAIIAVAVFALIAQRERTLHTQVLLARQHALVNGLINAQEEERRTLAYDLHDGLTQLIMATHSHLETFQAAQQEGDKENANTELEQGLHYLQEAVVESRRLINGLRSLALDDLGLVGALEQLMAEEKVHANWQQANLIQNVGERRFDSTLETTVFRVAQEALTNARKHANTSKIELRLHVKDGDQPTTEHFTLEVQDWGCGFLPEQKTKDYSHIGLEGMRERVHLLGGTYRLESTPGKGTLIRAIIPLHPSQPRIPIGEV
jgi:signal transduction histidine kinase